MTHSDDRSSADAQTTASTSSATSQPSDPAIGPIDPAMTKLNWKWMLALGVIYLLGAFSALMNPFFASIMVQSLIAAAFIVGGGIGLVMALRNEDGTTGGRLLSAVTALIAILFGVALLVFPLAGLLSLTLTIAGFLIALGIARVFVGFRMRAQSGWGWIVASGVLTTLLGIYLLVTLPVAAWTFLGLIFAIELAFAGVAYCVAGWQARRKALDTPKPEGLDVPS